MATEVVYTDEQLEVIREHKRLSKEKEGVYARIARDQVRAEELWFEYECATVSAWRVVIQIVQGPGSCDSWFAILDPDIELSYSIRPISPDDECWKDETTYRAPFGKLITLDSNKDVSSYHGVEAIFREFADAVAFAKKHGCEKTFEGVLAATAGPHRPAEEIREEFEAAKKQVIENNEVLPATIGDLAFRMRQIKTQHKDIDFSLPLPD